MHDMSAILGISAACNFGKFQIVYTGENSYEWRRFFATTNFILGAGTLHASFCNKLFATPTFSRVLWIRVSPFVCQSICPSARPPISLSNTDFSKLTHEKVKNGNRKVLRFLKYIKKVNNFLKRMIWNETPCLRELLFLIYNQKYDHTIIITV